MTIAGNGDEGRTFLLLLGIAVFGLIAFRRDLGFRGSDRDTNNNKKDPHPHD